VEARAASREDAEAAAYDVAINATSLGMKPGDELPISAGIVERSAVVAECVISPEKTRLLQLAQQMGPCAP
jgi:shikimate dehydrogenase